MHIYINIYIYAYTYISISACIYACVRINACYLSIFGKHILRSLGEVQQLSPHMIAIMVVYFLFQEIPCRELSQLGKGKIIFKSFLVGDNYLSGKDSKPLAETISPLQAPPPRNQLSLCFFPKKYMLQNDPESHWNQGRFQESQSFWMQFQLECYQQQA